MITVYDFDVTDPEELRALIWEMSNRIRTLEDKVEALENEAKRKER